MPINAIHINDTFLKAISTFGDIAVAGRLPAEAEELLKSSLYNPGMGDNLHAKERSIMLMVSVSSP